MQPHPTYLSTLKILVNIRTNYILLECLPECKFDGVTDLYSLAILVYDSLAGRMPLCNAKIMHVRH